MIENKTITFLGKEKTIDAIEKAFITLLQERNEYKQAYVDLRGVVNE